MLYCLETLFQRMVIVQSAKVGTQPHSSLRIPIDTPYRSLRQSSLPYRITVIHLKAVCLLVINIQRIDSAYPQLRFRIQCQHTNIIGTQTFVARTIMSNFPTFRIKQEKPVSLSPYPQFILRLSENDKNPSVSLRRQPLHLIQRMVRKRIDHQFPEHSQIELLTVPLYCRRAQALQLRRNFLKTLFFLIKQRKPFRCVQKEKSAVPFFYMQHFRLLSLWKIIEIAESVLIHIIKRKPPVRTSPNIPATVCHYRTDYIIRYACRV